MVAGGVGHDRDAGGSDLRADTAGSVRIEVAEPVGMADHHLALHSERHRARADLLHREGAERAEIVEVDIDADAAPFRHAEDDVEMAVEITIEARRIEAADEIGAEADRRIQKLRRAGARKDTALREGDELDVDDVAIVLAHLQDRLQRLQPDRAVHHDVAAHLERAVGDAQLELLAGALVHRRSHRHVLGLEGDALMHVEAVGAGFVGDPPVAVEAGVEVDMPFHEARHEQRAGDVDAAARLAPRPGAMETMRPPATPISLKEPSASFALVKSVSITVMSLRARSRRCDQ